MDDADDFVHGPAPGDDEYERELVRLEFTHRARGKAPEVVHTHGE